MQTSPSHLAVVLCLSILMSCSMGSSGMLCACSSGALCLFHHKVSIRLTARRGVTQRETCSGQSFSTARLGSSWTERRPTPTSVCRCRCCSIRPTRRATTKCICSSSRWVWRRLTLPSQASALNLHRIKTLSSAA